jgi:hypothetical protein
MRNSFGATHDPESVSHWTVWPFSESFQTVGEWFRHFEVDQSSIRDVEDVAVVLDSWVTALKPQRSSGPNRQDIGTFSSFKTGKIVVGCTDITVEERAYLCLDDSGQPKRDSPHAV